MEISENRYHYDERAIRDTSADTYGAEKQLAARSPSMSARCLAILSLIALSAPVQAQDISWQVEQFDPAAARGEPAADLNLPMPCGGAMSFQRVVVPEDGTGPLAYKREARSGSSTQNGRGLLDHFDSRHLQGGFLDPQAPAASHFYIARYEMTADQAATLRGNCPPLVPQPKGVLPELGLSWLDAYELGRRYTEWLIINAAAALPNEGETVGFLRMPTEAEWEYTARGGDKIAPTAFIAPAYHPMEGGIDAHAWHQQASRGDPQRIGLRRANPLGLHDIYGNAEELMLEPFRGIDGEGDIGQEDMLVTRGGHYLSSSEDLNSTKRNEWSIRRADGSDTAEDTFGLRLVLSTRLAVAEAHVDYLAGNRDADVTGYLDAEDSTDFAQLEFQLRTERARVAELRDELERTQERLAEAEAARETPTPRILGGLFLTTFLLAVAILIAAMLFRPRRPVEILLRCPRSESRRNELPVSASPTRTGEDLTRLAEGEIVDGEVKSLGRSCAFVDLGGIDGVMHVSEMGDDKIESPSELLSAGDAVKVRIIEIDPDSRHVSLGLEELQPNDSRPKAAAKKDGV